MQPIYPLNFYIIQAFRNRKISSAENGCGTEGVEQIRTAAPGTAFFNKKCASEE